MKRLIIFLFVFQAVFAGVKIADLSLFRTDYSALIESLMTAEPSIDIILGPAEGLGGDSNKARIIFADSLGSPFPFPADTFHRSAVIADIFADIIRLASVYDVTIIPGTFWEVDSFYRCYESVPIIKPSGLIKRIRKKARYSFADPHIDTTIRLDTIITRESDTYTFLITISDETASLPEHYTYSGEPADIWLLMTRRWGQNFDRIGRILQNECDPPWATIEAIFPETVFSGLISGGWVKPDCPFIACVLGDTAGATFASNLMPSLRPADDWFIYPKYDVHPEGIIVYCDPLAPKTTPGFTVIATDTAGAPVESLFINYGPPGTVPWFAGWTDTLGKFKHRVFEPDSFYFLFAKPGFIPSPEETTVYIDPSAVRCTLKVILSVDTLYNIGEAGIPTYFRLGISPNPFNGACEIEVPQGATVDIFDINGRLLKSFYSDQNTTDKNDLAKYYWKPEEYIPTGIYLVKASNIKKEISRKIVYLK